MTSGPTIRPGPRPVDVATWAFAFAWVAGGLAAMVLLTPRVPYADPWRFVARFLTLPFPANVFASDNGHCEVFPNFVRLADLLCCSDQWLQTLVGMLLAVATCVGVWSIFRFEPPAHRASAALVTAVGLFWLGNGRKLAHANESVSMFSVLLCLVAGLHMLRTLGQALSRYRIMTAAACGFVATFCFGAGLATFAAFSAVLVLSRAPLRRLGPIVLATLVATALLVLGHGRGPTFEPAVLDRLDFWVRWLGAPIVWAASPLLDPDHAARLPVEALRVCARPVADAAHAAFGPHLAARWPAALLGGGGLAWLLYGSYRHRANGGSSAERLSLGLAWFGASVGALVVAFRLALFREHPDQITTQRYLPWAMIMWTGLVLAHVARARGGAAALWPAFVFALLLTPSLVWTGRYAWKTRVTAERTALGAAVGVLERDYPLVETRAVDLDAATPLLRAAGKAMFAWPEIELIGRRPDPAALRPVAIEVLTAAAVANRFDGDGSRVEFVADSFAGDRLVLLGDDDTVLGVGARVPFTARWCGYVRAATPPRRWRAAALR